MSSNVELIRALGVLSEPPGPQHGPLAEMLELGGTPDPESYAASFLLQLHPYASVYVGSEGMLGGEARDRVAGAWSALGRTPPAEPDHLGALLGLYAALAEHAGSESDPAEKALWGAAASGLLWEHLLSWTTPYLGCFERAGSPVYAAWARLLTETLRDEGRRWGPPAVLPLHLRRAAELPDPRAAGSEAFLAGLLAPVRSGLLLTRTDLARAAAHMDAGLRMGERRFALSAFFSQDADRTLEWLSREAESWARRHTYGADGMELIADFWSARARATGDLLESLRESDVRKFDGTDDALNGSEVATDARN
jgi:hypothetical protein